MVDANLDQVLPMVLDQRNTLVDAAERDPAADRAVVQAWIADGTCDDKSCLGYTVHGMSFL
ncbi:hypothetical protein PG1C_13885 [Rugosibacter aromaticivorans]|uniref:Uncharacterized protein n=1 Tax=Rugosibacter aromaticivorans TaxID=1565605 RepID=A0A0C5JBK8_9PROT|nr:hypothetical protein PG1C_13885 [Rugosibacter aromaticivorans]